MVGAATEEDESVSETGCSFVGSVARASKPDRDRPSGFGDECRSVDSVEAARQIDHWLGEELSQQLDLFRLSGTPRGELLPKGFVFDVAPADANTEPQTAARKQIDIGGLARHKGGLALRKAQDPGREADALRRPSQVSKHDKRVVEWVMFVVWAGQLRRSVSVYGTQYVVVGEEVVKARSST